MYVGGTDFVLKLDVEDYHIIEVGVLTASVLPASLSSCLMVY